MKKRTCVLGELLDGAKFTWGEIVAFHHIGPYSIAEFHPWLTDGPRVLTGAEDEKTTHFHGWVDGRDVAESWASLDAAIVGCVAYRAEGGNHRADQYFMRMIKEWSAKPTPHLPACWP